MISIQKHLRQLLQTVSSKMLPIILCLDALFEHFKQSANKPIPVKNLHCTAQIQLQKAMNGLFKYNVDRA